MAATRDDFGSASTVWLSAGCAIAMEPANEQAPAPCDDVLSGHDRCGIGWESTADATWCAAGTVVDAWAEVGDPAASEMTSMTSTHTHVIIACFSRNVVRDAVMASGSPMPQRTGSMLRRPDTGK